MIPWIGQPLPRFEDPPLLAGDGRFVADFAEGASFLRFVRSPVAHGRIVSIEVPEGVTAFTAEDLRAVRPIRPLLHRPDYQPIEQPVLASGKVRFVGEPVAAVVAGTPEEAEDAAEQVFWTSSRKTGLSAPPKPCSPALRSCTITWATMSWWMPASRPSGWTRSSPASRW